jgi:hypothetical protein
MISRIFSQLGSSSNVRRLQSLSNPDLNNKFVYAKSFIRELEQRKEVVVSSSSSSSTTTTTRRRRRRTISPQTTDNNSKIASSSSSSSFSSYKRSFAYSASSAANSINRSSYDDDDDDDDEKKVTFRFRDSEENRFYDPTIMTTFSAEEWSDACLNLYYEFEQLQYQLPLHIRHPISAHWKIVDRTFKVTEEYSRLSSTQKRKPVFANSISILTRLELYESGFRNYLVVDQAPWSSNIRHPVTLKIYCKILILHALTCVGFYFSYAAMEIFILPPIGVDGFPHLESLRDFLNDSCPRIFQNRLMYLIVLLSLVSAYAVRKNTEKMFLTFASYSASFRRADRLKQSLQKVKTF